jgi:hypothetical protein
MIPLDKIKSILTRQGHQIINAAPFKGFAWQPDILAKKNGELTAYIIRESDSVSEVLIQRIASIKLSRIRIRKIIIFCKKPNLFILNLIKLYQIGVSYLQNNRLTEIARPHSLKIRTKPYLSRKAPKKMSKTDVFISSHQKIRERDKARQVIDNIRDTYKFPIFAILIEDDSRYTINRTSECMDDNMRTAELFIGILADQYRKDVNYEIRKSFKMYDINNILITIKSIRNRPKLLEKLIRWIKKQDSVKYQEYSDNKTLERKLNRWLMEKIQNIHRRQGIPFNICN